MASCVLTASAQRHAGLYILKRTVQWTSNWCQNILDQFCNFLMMNSQVLQMCLSFMMPLFPYTTFFKHPIPLQTIVNDSNEPFFNLCIMYTNTFPYEHHVSRFMLFFTNWGPWLLSLLYIFESMLPFFCFSYQSAIKISCISCDWCD